MRSAPRANAAPSASRSRASSRVHCWLAELVARVLPLDMIERLETQSLRRAPASTRSTRARELRLALRANATHAILCVSAKWLPSVAKRHRWRANDTLIHTQNSGGKFARASFWESRSFSADAALSTRLARMPRHGVTSLPSERSCNRKLHGRVYHQPGKRGRSRLDPI